MTNDLEISDLGGYTNNLSNKDGIKKLLAKIKSLISGKQDKLTAGDNVAISDENVISASDTKYTAGTNVEITEENVINVTVPSGDWTKRASNKDWTDLFSVDDDTHNITALKDILIAQDNNPYFIYIPKGYTVNNSFKLIYQTYTVRQEDTQKNIVLLKVEYTVAYTDIPSATGFSGTNYGIQFPRTASTPYEVTSFTSSTSNTKSSFRIYTK